MGKSVPRRVRSWHRSMIALRNSPEIRLAAIGPVIHLASEIGIGDDGARVAIKRPIPQSTELKPVFMRWDLPC